MRRASTPCRPPIRRLDLRRRRAAAPRRCSSLCSSAPPSTAPMRHRRRRSSLCSSAPPPPSTAPVRRRRRSAAPPCLFAARSSPELGEVVRKPHTPFPLSLSLCRSISPAIPRRSCASAPSPLSGHLRPPPHLLDPLATFPVAPSTSPA